MNMKCQSFVKNMTWIMTKYVHGMMDIVFLEMNMYLDRTPWFRQCWMVIVRIIGRRQ